VRRRGKEEEESAASVVACGDADVRSVLYPFNFVEVPESAVATEEKQEKEDDTTTPPTGTQGEDERMARLGCGPPAFVTVVASLRRAASGEHDPAEGTVYAAARGPVRFYLGPPSAGARGRLRS
jgi:hypothetical protein